GRGIDDPWPVLRGRPHGSEPRAGGAVHRRHPPHLGPASPVGSAPGAPDATGPPGDGPRLARRRRSLAAAAGGRDRVRFRGLNGAGEDAERGTEPTPVPERSTEYVVLMSSA